ncbi:AraC family transcriptional regulator [Amycolatopsis acidiphila]|uniref:AraC family transcriptional regulator n=2 Tax=Amycolatopsis acidiphila TaxID=715473 RepID=A0A558ANS2_9PSEU|nr:AraC family transcriptional regulator [Amycolatopsis acidiphila]
MNAGSGGSVRFGMNEPLRTRPLLDSRDVEHAHAEITGLFSPHELIPIGLRSGFHARANVATLNRVRLIYLSLGSEVVVRPAPLTDYYAINIVIGGAADVRRGRRAIAVEGSTAGVVLTPDSTIDMRWSADCRHLSVVVGRSHLEEAFWSLWGDVPRPEDFPIGLDLRMGRVASWIRLVRWAVADIDQGSGLAANPLAAKQVEDLLVHGFVAAQGRRSGPQPSVRAMTQVAVRDAREYIESHAADAISVSDVARAAGVSVRTLQECFKRHVGMTPMTYLRDVRLDRVHGALRSADPRTAVTVTEVALSWGFGHLPRFAAAYRRRFGQLPSETLRRGVSRANR